MFVEHWNGTEWIIDSTPELTEGPVFDGVYCISTASCTAVGAHQEGNRGLAEAWNGTEWLVQGVEFPSEVTSVTLEGVACTATTTCTAVGRYTNSSGANVAIVANS